MNISEVASRQNITPTTLRYYEQRRIINQVVSLIYRVISIRGCYSLRNGKKFLILNMKNS
ncbi:MerR family transcriptional regulator [Listeria immobilis]|uniref:MerR family transcriptional regulator n=1 Tax=Listeria immobilis TaxID=2713502 RepID=UPI0031B5D620